MKRPAIVHFIAIHTEEHLHIKTSLTNKNVPDESNKKIPFAEEVTKSIAREMDLPAKASFPIQAFRLLKGQSFSIKVIAFDNKRNVLFKKMFESDSVGAFNFKIPLLKEYKELKALQVFEVSQTPGLDIYLGSFIPLIINNPKKIIICDFDKTLVDTRYSTTKDVYKSLTKPIHYFPTVTNSVALVKSYIEKDFHPFILSASPHFYEDAMRDWLYQNHIFTAGVFLKDYRHIFNFLELDLTPKDLKVQGMYKLNHLLDILLMVGVPDEIILVGDNFESDPIIYLALCSLLKGEMDPWKFTNFLGGLDSFQMNKKQEARLLSKSYQIVSSLGQWNKNKDRHIKIKIYIRKKALEDKIIVPKILEKNLPLLELYEGLTPMLEAPLLNKDQRGSEENNKAD
jgi:hypothetical protein